MNHLTEATSNDRSRTDRPYPGRVVRSRKALIRLVMFGALVTSVASAATNPIPDVAPGAGGGGGGGGSPAPTPSPPSAPSAPSPSPSVRPRVVVRQPVPVLLPPEILVARGRALGTPIVPVVQPPPATTEPVVTVPPPSTTETTPPVTTTPPPSTQPPPTATATDPVVVGGDGPTAVAAPAQTRGVFERRSPFLVLLGVLVAALLVIGRTVREHERRVGLVLLAGAAFAIAILGAILAASALAAPPPPTNFTATPADSAVQLAFDPLPAGSTLVVLRRAGSPPATCTDAAVVTVPVPAEVTSYLDAGLPNGVEQHYIACVSLDGELSAPARASATPAIPIDRTAPDPPSDLAAARSPSGIIVSWRAAQSTVRVVIQRTRTAPAATPDDGIRIYDGPRRRTPIDVPFGRSRIFYTAFAFDANGNQSQPSGISTPAFRGSIRLGRSKNAVVSGIPRFTWRRIARADYYNVQIYRNRCCLDKVESRFPTRPSFARRRALKPGIYVWYVFAHVGPGERDFKRVGGAQFRVVG